MHLNLTPDPPPAPPRLPCIRDLADLLRDHLPPLLVKLTPLKELRRRCAEIVAEHPRFREEAPLVLDGERQPPALRPAAEWRANRQVPKLFSATPSASFILIPMAFPKTLPHRCRHRQAGARGGLCSPATRWWRPRSPSWATATPRPTAGAVYVAGPMPPALRSAVEQGHTDCEVLLVAELPAGIQEITLPDHRHEFRTAKSCLTSNSPLP